MPPVTRPGMVSYDLFGVLQLRDKQTVDTVLSFL